MEYKNLAKIYNVTSAFVQEEYEKLVVDLEEKGLTGIELETEAEELINHVLRTLTAKSKGERFIGMVLAIDKIKDMANLPNKLSKRQIHVNAYVANPNETVADGKVAVISIEDGTTIRTMKDRKTGAIKKETVTPDIWKEYVISVGDVKVVPLDDIKSWANGKDNLGYLRNLPLHQYRTSVVIALKTETGYRLAELDYNSEKLLGNVPMYVSVEFVAIMKEEKEGILHLGTSKFTSFEVSKEEFGKTPLELIQAFLGSIKYPINKLEEYHTQMVRAGKKWDTLVMVEAWVSDIRGLDKTPFLLVNDNTTPTTEPLLKVFLHDGIDINFGINSKVYIIGKTSQGDKWTPEDGVMKGVPGPVTVWAMGCYCKYNTRPTNVKPVTEINL
jgi:hypothetical protein